MTPASVEGREVVRHETRAAHKALVALEDRGQRFETALMQVLDALTIGEAKGIARRAISDAYYGPPEERGGTA